MLEKRPELPFWIALGAMALVSLIAPLRRDPVRQNVSSADAEKDRPFGEPRSSEEPQAIELSRALERGRGRRAAHPLQIPWQGWKDISWRTYAEMQSDRLLSIAGGVAFFVLLAIFPAITALVSAYGLFFNASTIANNLSLLQDVVPENVLSIVHEQAARIAANSGGTLSTGIVVGILVSLWSAMSGAKAMIDALNVIYEQQESRSFIKLNLVALAFTLGGFAAFLLVIACFVVLPPMLSLIGLGSATATLDAGPALARAVFDPVDRPRLTLPLRTGSARGALAMGQRRQHLCRSDVDFSLLPVLLVPRELRQLQRHLWLTGRRHRPDDVAVDFNHCGAAWRRAQRRDRASDGVAIQRSARRSRSGRAGR